MDGSWQSKCASSWPLPSSSLPPPDQAPSTEISRGFPYIPQAAQSSDRSLVQDPFVFSTSNLGYLGSSRQYGSELGNSFLALLSGPTHLELQQLSNTKPLVANAHRTQGQNFVPNFQASNFKVNGSENSFSLDPTGQFTLLPDNTQKGNSFYMTNVNKPMVSNSVHANEMGRGATFLRQGNTPLVSQHHISDVLALPKITPDANFSFTQRGGRVFCLGTRGDLLLNDVGCLVVICLCHGLPMSVAKFCKHSGSSAVNPGEAVYMETGGSIALWRRICFPKFGMRPPDDNSGWDFSYEISSPSDLVKPSSSAQPCTLNKFSAVQTTDISEVSSTSRKFWNAGTFLNNQVSSREGIDTLQIKNSLLGLSNGKTFVDDSNGCHRPPEIIKPARHKGQQYIEFQNVASSFNPFSKGSTVFNFNPCSDSLKFFGTDSSVHGGNNSAQEGYVFGSSGIASNVELTLGQPSHSLIDPIQSSSHPFSEPCDPQKSLLHLPFFQTYVHSKASESLSSPSFSPSSLSISHQREKEIQLSHVSESFRDAGVIDTAKVETVNDVGASQSSIISMFLPQVPPLGGPIPTRPHVTDCSSTSNQHTMACGMPCTDSYNGKVDHSKLVLNGTDGVQAQSLSKSHLSNIVELAQGISSTGQSVSYVSPKPNSFLHNKQIGEASHIVANTGGYQRHTVPHFQEINASLARDRTRALACPVISTKPGLPSSAVTKLSSLSKSLWTSSNTDGVDVSEHMLDGNLRSLALRNMIELSKQEKPLQSFQVNTDQTHLWCTSQMETCRGLIDQSPKRIQDSSQPSMAVEPDVAWRPFQPCCNHYLNSNFENAAGLGGYCHCLTSVLGFPLGSRRICGCADDQSLLRLGQAEDNNVSGHIEHGGHNQVHLNPHVSGACCCAAHTNRLAHKCYHSQNQRVIPGGNKNLKNGEDAMTGKILSSNLGENSLNMGSYSKNNSHSFQWKDVPSKNVGHGKRPEEVLGTNQAVNNHILKTPAKELNGPCLDIELVKEQRISDVFPGSSAPAITEVSVDLDKASSVLGAGDGESMPIHLVDEGSGTGKYHSSDESQRGVETLKAGCSSVLSNRTSHELDLVKSTCRSRNHIPPLELNTMERKKRRTMKWKTMGASGPSADHDSLANTRYCDGSLKSDLTIQKKSFEGSCGSSNVKLKRSASSSVKTSSKKRSFPAYKDHNSGDRTDLKNESRSSPAVRNDDSKNDIRWDWSSDKRSMHYGENQNEVDACRKRPRPVVCGRLGIISNGKLFEGHAKPIKIVSLSLLLKVAKRCKITEQDPETNLSYTADVTALPLSKKEGCSKRSSCFKYGKASEVCSVSKRPSKCQKPSSTSGMKVSGCQNGVFSNEFQKKENSYGGREAKEGVSLPKLSSRLRELRKRSLYELTDKGKHPSSPKVVASDKASEPSQSRNLRSYKNPSLRSIDDLCEPLADDLNSNKSSISKVKYGSPLDSDAFCCVCGSSNKDEINCLLECSSCSLRVHQACYGVLKLPKGRWCCRPCRANSQDVVCVLCGYEGGAMTQALRSHSVVKSLLKAWKVDRLSYTCREDLGSFVATVRGGISEVGKESQCGVAIYSIDAKGYSAIPGTDMMKRSNSRILSCQFKVQNSITAGALDPTVKQWVHMVCGLWTPGTRCPNVHTMSAFDVSGASHASKNLVCSMCNRPGGLCIKCRVLKCSVMFHPWCAHQKGLLQSEIEGVDDECVGFYGRCLLHATNGSSHTHRQPVEKDVSTEHSDNDGPTCSRAEGYKGWKAGQSSRYNFDVSSKRSGCLVPQEQINAWVHINGQKSSARGKVIKPLLTESEFDCRKEYARYKQAKGWKNLVVYKSGIHALGLYTSQFISRGAMVVEYVGEIVGLRVADKREIEYQSGRKLQYESACYFFRIDKEHIVDATHRGGIARFVNHSCLPNCVARIVSIRNEKKVVFFAQRDINPGEEITYDYHFNHEDEGKKIPCYCRSKNCRKYLN